MATKKTLWVLLSLIITGQSDYAKSTSYLEGALARLNERPEDVLAYLKDKGRGGQHFNPIVLVKDDYAEDGHLLKVALDLGITVPSPGCGTRKQGQTSRYVALPKSLSRYSNMDILCLNLEFCPGHDKDKRLACLLDPQQQRTESYQQSRSQLLQSIRDQLRTSDQTVLDLTQTQVTSQWPITQSTVVESIESTKTTESGWFDSFGWPGWGQQDQDYQTKEGVGEDPIVQPIKEMGVGQDIIVQSTFSKVSVETTPKSENDLSGWFGNELTKDIWQEQPLMEGAGTDPSEQSTVYEVSVKTTPKTENDLSSLFDESEGNKLTTGSNSRLEQPQTEKDVIQASSTVTEMSVEITTNVFGDFLNGFKLPEGDEGTKDFSGWPEEENTKQNQDPLTLQDVSVEPEPQSKYVFPYEGSGGEYENYIFDDYWLKPQQELTTGKPTTTSEPTATTQKTTTTKSKPITTTPKPTTTTPNPITTAPWQPTMADTPKPTTTTLKPTTNTPTPTRQKSKPFSEEEGSGEEYDDYGFAHPDFLHPMNHLVPVEPHNRHQN